MGPEFPLSQALGGCVSDRQGFLEKYRNAVRMIFSKTRSAPTLTGRLKTRPNFACAMENCGLRQSLTSFCLFNKKSDNRFCSAIASCLK